MDNYLSGSHYLEERKPLQILFLSNQCLGDIAIPLPHAEGIIYNRKDNDVLKDSNFTLVLGIIPCEDGDRILNVKLVLSEPNILLEKVGRPSGNLGRQRR